MRVIHWSFVIDIQSRMCLEHESGTKPVMHMLAGLHSRQLHVILEKHKSQKRNRQKLKQFPLIQSLWILAAEL